MNVVCCSCNSCGGCTACGHGAPHMLPSAQHPSRAACLITVPCCALPLPCLALQSAPMQQRVAEALQQAADEPAAAGRRYLAVAAPPRSNLAGGPEAVLLLRQEADASDLLEGYCAALLLAWAAQLLRNRASWPAAAQRALADVDSWLAGGRQQQVLGIPAVGTRSRSRSSGAAGDSGNRNGSSGSGLPAFVSALTAAGWTLDRVALLQGPARLAWGPTELRSH